MSATIANTKPAPAGATEIMDHRMQAVFHDKQQSPGLTLEPSQPI